MLREIVAMISRILDVIHATCSLSGIPLTAAKLGKVA